MFQTRSCRTTKIIFILKFSLNIQYCEVNITQLYEYECGFLFPDSCTDPRGNTKKYCDISAVLQPHRGFSSRNESSEEVW